MTGKRDRLLTFRVTDDELEDIDREAERLGRSRAWVVRRRVIDAYEAGRSAGVHKELDSLHRPIAVGDETPSLMEPRIKTTHPDWLEKPVQAALEVFADQDVSRFDGTDGFELVEAALVAVGRWPLFEAWFARHEAEHGEPPGVSSRAAFIEGSFAAWRAQRDGRP